MLCLNCGISSPRDDSRDVVYAEMVLIEMAMPKIVAKVSSFGALKTKANALFYFYRVFTKETSRGSRRQKRATRPRSALSLRMLPFYALGESKMIRQLGMLSIFVLLQSFGLNGSDRVTVSLNSWNCRQLRWQEGVI